MADHEKDKTTLIKVNNKDITIQGKKATGLGIKQAAIAQGVAIQETFPLKMQNKDGGWEPVADSDTVVLNPQHLIFRALEGDENS